METENQALTSQLIQQSGIYTFVRYANEQRDESEIDVRGFAFTPEQSRALENLFMPVFKEKLLAFANRELEDMGLDPADAMNRNANIQFIRIEHLRLYNIISPPHPDDPSNIDLRPSNPIISIKKNALDAAYRSVFIDIIGFNGLDDLDSTVDSSIPSTLESSPPPSPISLSSLSTDSGPEYTSQSSRSSSVGTRRIRGGKTKPKRGSKTKSKKRTSQK
jgi:hypothetical protein